ncbi:MAG: dethiobiotin synthase [Planctomycetaceae bacterium]|jgi:dethiobiotin synthetase|nr:dethiobiotin synthase [Planctomycetaceae bacterium]
MSLFFVTGIDTGIGKTEAAGVLARSLRMNGISAVTQKLIQTGQTGQISEDILRHRELMETGLLPEDWPQSFSTGTLTCPYSFSFPASPHLAAELEGRIIDTEKLTEATEILQSRFAAVLIEGSGGLFVPISDSVFMIDYLEQRRYPVVLVTSGRLGSINHTLLTLESVRQRGIPLAGLVFNQYPQVDETLAGAALRLFRRFCPNILLLPPVDPRNIPAVDLSFLQDK